METRRDGREGRALRQVFHAALDLLDLPLHFGKRLTDLERVINLGRFRKQIKQPGARGIKIAEPRLEVYVLLRHIFAANGSAEHLAG